MGDFIGPVIPESLKKTVDHSGKDNEDDESEVIGPALPPGWNKDIPKEEVRDQIIGPILPPNPTRKRLLDAEDDKYCTKSSEKSNKSKKVIGPSLPPGFGEKHDEASYIGPSVSTSDDHNDSDEDDEFTIGPLPPSGNFIEVEESRHQKSAQVPTGSKGLQREEWIASLPENSSVAQKLGFGKSMTSFSSKPVTTKVITPVDQDGELDAAVDEYNKVTRPEALVDTHMKKMKEKKKEEAPTRQLFDFNPEEDLKIRQLDSKQTKSIMEKAKLLNSRFSNPRGQNKFL